MLESGYSSFFSDCLRKEGGGGGGWGGVEMAFTKAEYTGGMFMMSTKDEQPCNNWLGSCCIVSVSGIWLPFVTKWISWKVQEEEKWKASLSARTVNE